MRTGPHQELIAAMRAESIAAPQDGGLWYIERRSIPDVVLPEAREALRKQWLRMGDFDRYQTIAPVITSLMRWTDATLEMGHGESVMSDDPRELCRHLPIVLAGAGRVLVTGLGLGCVVRGLLARPQVAHIDVVEIDADVLAMVAPSFAGESRVTIHHDDALTIRWPDSVRWNFAWHDVWGLEPDTQILHAMLLRRYQPLARHQGAWAFPRWAKRCWSIPLLNAARENRCIVEMGCNPI